MLGREAGDLGGHAGEPTLWPRGRLHRSIAAIAAAARRSRRYGGEHGDRRAVRADGPPDHARERDRARGARKRVILVRGRDPRQRARGRADHRAPAPRPAAAGHGAAAHRRPQPRRLGRRHPAERARRGPQPQLPLRLAGDGQPVRHLPLRPRAAVGARVAGRWRRSSARAPARDPLLPPDDAARGPRREGTASSSASTRAAPACHTGAYPAAARAPPPGGRTTPSLATRAFVVELPAGPLSRAAVARHAGAVLALARAVAPPREVSRPIPFGDNRKREMRAYARRHYGIDDFRLRPRVIVEHFTASNSFASAFNTFASNTPDVELGELPGVCAHYLIDRDGTIARLVPDHDHVPPHRRASTTRRSASSTWAPATARCSATARQLRGLAAAHALAPGPPPHRHPQRDRPQREPLAPLPPRARRAAAQPDPRRLHPALDEPLPPRAAAGWRRAGQPALSARSQRLARRTRARSTTTL